jgi:hypothetical protein
LITLSLLLCAIRDAAAKQGFKALADEISQTYLTHPFNVDKDRYRVYPRLRDREDYLAAVEGKVVPRGTIGEALLFFHESLPAAPKSGTEEGLREFFRSVISGLEFVHITLQGENPYRIFRSLNSTGVDLAGC